MMDVKRVISTIERKYIKNNLKKEERVDGRGLWDYREFKIDSDVIASAEGALNWIQSHKALFNASRAVRANGRIILLAPCPEGLGDERFRHWVRKSSVSGIFRELHASAEVLGQTALSTKTKAPRTVLVTSMSSEDTDALGMETAPDMEAAVTVALDRLREAGTTRPTYYVMPEARYTVPFA